MCKKVLLAATVLLLTAAVQAVDPKAESLDGEWEVTSAKLDGKDAPAGKYGVKLTIQGNTYAWLYNSGRTIEKGKVSFKNDKTPREILLTDNINRLTRKWIYERNGDTLKVAFYNSAKQPTNFDDKGPGHLLILYQKVK